MDSLIPDRIRRFVRSRSAVWGGLLISILLAVALFAPVLAPHNPLDQSFPRQLQPPSAGFWLGTDEFGRDILSRIIFGARIALGIGALAVGIAVAFGVPLGLVAGYFGGRLDTSIMRTMDVVLSFPSLLLAIVIVTVLGSGLINAQLAIGIVSIPIYARVMRASVLSIREQDYVTASRALGESGTGILFRRILPNALTPLIVQATLGIGGAILEVAALSFVGLGAEPPLAEWGSMIAADRKFVTTVPTLVLFPGFAITLTVLGFNLLGDGIRDALDPRLNR